MQTLHTLSGHERQQVLTRLLEKSGWLSVAQICDQFSISEATDRRDLAELSEQGILRRVHGGAVLIHKAAPEKPILLRSNEQKDEKERIGRATPSLVQEGETVFLGSGTPVLEGAQYIKF